MTKENKDLLIKDLCGRVPYGLKYNYGDNDGCDYTMDRISQIAVDDAFPIEDIKPYLRPMSSMTEEEKKEYRNVCELDTKILEKCPMNGEEPFPALYNSQDWLNAHHFDYRGLIEKGLAVAAPDWMYETE